ncbi:MAG: imidazole glycerol phosphate synthase subunit HisH, partial [bacterium]
MIAIVNYGSGNLYSVKKAFEIFNNNVIISNKPWDINRADKIVLPGVGHFKDVMESIKRLGLLEALIEAGKNKPILGICLGMQILLEESEEGNTQGLSILKGKVIRFPKAVKVP